MPPSKGPDDLRYSGQPVASPSDNPDDRILANLKAMGTKTGKPASPYDKLKEQLASQGSAAPAAPSQRNTLSFRPQPRAGVPTTDMTRPVPVNQPLPPQTPKQPITDPTQVSSADYFGYTEMPAATITPAPDVLQRKPTFVSSLLSRFSLSKLLGIVALTVCGAGILFLIMREP
ncbi:MAG TPA: hypothetical protein PKL83_06495, partial [bacterium]|nr:hypothetical protein [bacterium]